MHAQDLRNSSDLNSDGTLTVADATIVLEIAVGGSASCDATTLAAADMIDYHVEIRIKPRD